MASGIFLVIIAGLHFFLLIFILYDFNDNLENVFIFYVRA